MLRKELARYFEKLRFERGMSQETFIGDTISISQYKRYLNGTNAMPFRVIVELSSQLGLKYDYILDEFDYAKNNERKVVTQMMNLIVNYDYESFDKLIKELDPDFILEKRNKLIYHYTLILKDLFQHKITNESALYQLSKLIDYPNILSIKTLSVSEFMILGEIATLLPTHEQAPVLKKLKEILDNPKQVISGNNEKLVVMLLVRLIKILGINNNFKDALYYCEIGINICNSIRTYYSLDYLYYYASLCHHQLGDMDKRNEMIYLTFMTSRIDGNLKKHTKFVKLLESDYRIKLSEFMMAYWQK